jgi:hypothetical protein
MCSAELDPTSGDWSLTDFADKTVLGTPERVKEKQTKIHAFKGSPEAKGSPVAAPESAPEASGCTGPVSGECFDLSYIGIAV